MVLVKFLHLLALMLGAAASIANLIIARRIGASTGDTSQLAALRPLFARLGLFAVLLIWLTGLWLYIASWRGAALGPVFALKLLAAAALLAAIAAINVSFARAARTGNPPPAFIRRLGPATLALLLIAVAAAVWVFG